MSGAAKPWRCPRTWIDRQGFEGTPFAATLRRQRVTKTLKRIRKSHARKLVPRSY
jgi:hypothetical protein